jgi:hypothetical protein
LFVRRSEAWECSVPGTHIMKCDGLEKMTMSLWGRGWKSHPESDLSLASQSPAGADSRDVYRAQQVNSKPKQPGLASTQAKA